MPDVIGPVPSVTLDKRWAYLIFKIIIILEKMIVNIFLSMSTEDNAYILGVYRKNFLTSFSYRQGRTSTWLVNYTE
ncbi:hypothetical protein NP92_12675 [Anoxybacillus gonensis]|nr:hypothetical protein AFK25_04100 [Anoxybacillus gonensis]KGP59685.1 hypothetical protein NP92_12675 [Anoxybacillus gonensis]